MTYAVPGAGQAGAERRPNPLPIANAIKSTYRRTMWALVLRGALGLAIGFLIFARPLGSVAALALVIALWALFDGGTNIARAFAIRKVVPHWWVLLLAGIVSVVFGGAALYYYPGLSLTFAVLWTGWWLLSAGVLAIYVAIQERRLEVPWGWTLFFGLVAIVTGIAALMYPGVTLSALMGLIAAFAIISGALTLVAALKLHGIAHDVRETMNAQ